MDKPQEKITDPLTRIEQLFEQLGYNRSNGLFYLNEAEDWIDKFPFRISKVLRDIIQPYAFYSLHHQGISASEHPEPINNPIILFFDKPSEDKKKEIPKWSFCFSQAPVVIINNSDYEPLDIFHGYQFESDHSYKLKSLNVNIIDFSIFNLTLGKTWKALFNKHYKNVPKVDRYLLNNIVDARRILVATDGFNLSPQIANRLIGRLLFIRYLIDRHVEFKDQAFISGSNKFERQSSLNDLIKSKNDLYIFFDYLTEKYEGDLFPLQQDFIDEETGEIISNFEQEHISQEHLDVLYHLFSCSAFFRTGSYKGYAVQPSFFMVYDFEVIPVELISNIYENFIGKKEENENVRLDKFYSKSKQYEIKAYYTPPFIVDYVLSQTVTPFLNRSNTSNCKVLDPACGSGIFLVETLRKIVEKEIKISKAKKGLSNTRLWELLRNNIFGIDIDEDAIEITIFSLYITLLDYKKPIEIEFFKFERLKSVNLFGGAQADFFNVNSEFNTIFENDIHLDFIVGNPPWGKVNSSVYEEYIENRKLKEKSIKGGQSNLVINPNLTLEIGNREIAQAFLIRVSDFALNPEMKIAFVITGKCLYNSDKTSKTWRQYFLNNFVVQQVVELSSVNNKIVGGNQIFEEAKQSPAIIFYAVSRSNELLTRNVLTHIAVKPNRFFNYFRTIVVEKHDIKKVAQRKFIEIYDGNDSLWKVLLHGNILDVYFIDRLKKEYKSAKSMMIDHHLKSNGGLKIKDGNKKKDTGQIKNFKFLEIESRKEFQPYRLSPSRTWIEEISDLKKKKSIDEFGNVGYLPVLHFFKGEKLLIKKGLKADEGFRAVTAYTDTDLAFTDSVCSVKLEEGKPRNSEATVLLKSLSGIMNSKLFTYFILHTGSSVGVDRTRAYFEEFLSVPTVPNQRLADMVDEIQNCYSQMSAFDSLDSRFSKLKNEAFEIERSINQEIYLTYNLSDIEKDLIDYSMQISIPVLKRAEETGYGRTDIFKVLKIDVKEDVSFLSEYAKIFVDHFKFRFNNSENSFYCNIHISEEFIGFHFIVDRLPKPKQTIYIKPSNSEFLTDIGNLGIHSVTRDLYIQQDVRGFNKNTFYVIKPNEKKCWHKAVAHHDLIEFIDALAKAESLISNPL